jgi:hypothetical protein
MFKKYTVDEESHILSSDWLSFRIDTILGLFFSSSSKKLTFLTFVQGSCRGFALLRDLERFFVRPKRRVAAKDENHQRPKGKDATVTAFEVFVVTFNILYRLS